MYHLATVGLLLAASGCGVPELETPQTAVTAQPTTTAPDESAPDEQTPADQQSATNASEPQSSNPGSPNPNEPPPVTSTPREVSDLDPARGKKSRAAGGYLGAVGGARFYAEHSLIFDQVRQALEMFNASNGYYPRSQEEFRDQIIRPNNIQLPALDAGVEYLYSPEEHKLMVWRPEDAETAPEPIEGAP
jgi:hypothetical protein